MYFDGDWEQVNFPSAAFFPPTHQLSSDKNRLLTFFSLHEAAWSVFARLQPELIELGSAFLCPRMTRSRIALVFETNQCRLSPNALGFATGVQENNSV